MDAPGAVPLAERLRLMGESITSYADRQELGPHDMLRTVAVTLAEMAAGLTEAAGERTQDYELRVTVRVYGPGDAEAAAQALRNHQSSFDMPHDAEAEILAAVPLVGPLGLPEVGPGEIEREFGAHDGDD